MKRSSFLLILVTSLSFSFVSRAQSPGDIVISEVMQNPDNVTDNNGEWFEVFNTTGSDIDLSGWIIEDSGTNSHIIGSSVIVPAGQFAVLCRNADAGANGGFACDYEYSNITLTNDADEIILSAPGIPTVEIDRVEYDDGANWPDPTGASMVFTGAATDDNNDPSNWSTATLREQTYQSNGNTDLGSPGTRGEVQTLPVELTSFTALADGRAVLLRWETASETNNAGFDIQQRMAVETVRATSLPWETLAFVDGYGTTERPQSYAYRLENLLPGRHRFRLKQIDFDGTVEYSPEVEVAVAVPGAYHLSKAYPNPFYPKTSFSISVVRAQHVEVAVYDLRGRRVAWLYDGTLEAGTTRAVTFAAGALPSGLYLIRIRGEYFSAGQAVVLAR